MSNLPPPSPVAPPTPEWISISPNLLVCSTHLSAFGAVSPIVGTEWSTTTSGSAQRYIPTHAIVLCVLFIWVCFLGLLFLAMKEERFTGEVTVSVRASDGHLRTESVPVASIADRDLVLARVAWAQQVAARGPQQ